MQNESDILREVGSIASGHGSTALSELLNKKINLEFPALDIITSLEVPSKIKTEKLAIAIYSKILTGIEGEIALLLDGDNASKLINLSPTAQKAAEKANPGFITEIGISLLKEIGNIIICTYLNALSMLLKKIIIPPIPTLVSGSIQEILASILLSYRDVDYCYLIESVFEEPGSNLKGSFFLVLTPYAAKDIKAICRKMLGETENE